jgi:ketosteroid isomerase-like protein
MSQRHVEIAQRAFEALNRDGVTGLLPFLDDDVEWISIPGFLPDAQDYRGHEGVVRWFERIEESFEDPGWEAEEVIDADDHVFVATRARGRGKSSGAPVEITVFHAVTVANGRVARLESYLQRDQALQAVGLEDNVETLRRAFERWQEGGAGFDAIPVELYAEDVEWDLSAYPLVDLATRGKGRDNLLDTFERYLSGWKNYEPEAQELTAAGEHVVVALHERATVADSDAVVERDVFQVWTLRDGLVSKWRVFETREEALQAVGLSE